VDSTEGIKLFLSSIEESFTKEVVLLERGIEDKFRLESVFRGTS
jgi:hypothetical protein